MNQNHLMVIVNHSIPAGKKIKTGRIILWQHIESKFTEVVWC